MYLYVVNSWESKGNMIGSKTEKPTRVICIEYTSGVDRSRQDITAASPKNNSHLGTFYVTSLVHNIHICIHMYVIEQSLVSKF